MDKLKGHRRLRKLVQGLFSLLTNAHLPGFLTGAIYTGPLKNFCVPGLNCYSCPGALGSCPVGSFQSMLSARHPKVSFYVLGYLGLIGVFVGRFICGWLCLFGLIQELLYKIPLPKLTIPKKLDQLLRYLKYAVLIVFVILLPLFLRSELGVSAPYFCKWICPAGMLEGGIPLVLLNQSLRSAAGLLYAWKLGILLLLIVFSIFVHRPFCKYLCPLGAFYGLFHKVSFLKLRVDPSACTHCGSCQKVCKMNIDPVKTPSSAECIRCGECTRVCPTGALKMGFRSPTPKTQERTAPQ